MVQILGQGPSIKKVPSGQRKRLRQNSTYKEIQRSFRNGSQAPQPSEVSQVVDDHENVAPYLRVAEMEICVDRAQSMKILKGIHILLHDHVASKAVRTYSFYPKIIFAYPGKTYSHCAAVKSSTEARHVLVLLYGQIREGVHILQRHVM